MKLLEIKRVIAALDPQQVVELNRYGLVPRIIVRLPPEVDKAISELNEGGKRSIQYFLDSYVLAFYRGNWDEFKEKWR